MQQNLVIHRSRFSVAGNGAAFDLYGSSRLLQLVLAGAGAVGATVQAQASNMPDDAAAWLNIGQPVTLSGNTRVQAERELSSGFAFARLVVSGLTGTLDAAVTSSTAPARASGGGTVAFNRPANTTAYAAGAVIGSSTAAGGAVLTLAGMGPRGARILLGWADMMINDGTVPSGLGGLRAYLYNASPPSNLGDGALFDLAAADRASFQGFLDLAAPVKIGSTLFSQTLLEQRAARLAAGSDTLYAYLVTPTAMTLPSAVGLSLSLSDLAP